MSRDKAKDASLAAVRRREGRRSTTSTSNGVRSPTYQLTVSDLPAVKQARDRPALSRRTRGCPTEHMDDGGDVAAVVGTTVTVRPTITMPVRSGTLTFDNGTTVPLVARLERRAERRRSASKTSGFYRVDLVAPDGANVPGSVQYAVDALPDRAPTVTHRAAGPRHEGDERRGGHDRRRAARTTTASSRWSCAIASTAARRSASRSTDSSRGARRSRAPRTRCSSRSMKLAPGDLIAYNAVARDGAGNDGSERRLLPRGASVRQELSSGRAAGRRRWWRWRRRRFAGRVRAAAA